MKREPETVEAALLRYRAAFAVASTSRMLWRGGQLHIDGGSEYVEAFEALQRARERVARKGVQTPR